MRIDKFLANMGYGTRNEVKQLLKKGNVTVNDQVIKLPKVHIIPEQDTVIVNGQIVEYVANVYIMLNKPKNYVSATEDSQHKTVIDLVPEYQHLNIFPVGRLDKDTEGLLLITNDGEFNHKLMSPQNHVPKTYEVISKKPIKSCDIVKFEQGIELSDGQVKPAILEIIDDVTSKVTIYEGKYHQVKRMFHSIENEVLELRRIKIANLELDSNLKLGQYRLLTETDFKQLNL
ncbi:rRNA pseudouridine synthase [Staphylococcus simiae]|uniref:pseudouridine synthase n=1 Tax=Staphylococcus simiae TaxID=308354 RepID=UPI001A972EFB|nr:pseudouridine synthase [Staphylococcus simiae]MBO1199612.1 rRNA pseudouridine synthase [Staphylococcus simiae]MBO1201485.1 rRNA pseudouridine synthase [Staphylococcus simiae]MBO1203633.1 rRNA pseudouridine synthase [Staphylococcus simiae]MBO1211631.1 rRNA pseudouridine synthase [Staphylococcus simiae]MBO1229866.1 rRNA pseudouridine synthase [Staphylococcus simiae]